MGTLSGGNGGGWPSDELPDLPPEWGTIVIPDDASELAREGARVRRELRWQARALRWRRRLHLPRAEPRPGEDDVPALGVPVLVILIATIATLTSLFVISWPTRPQQPDLAPTAVTTPSVGTPTSGADDPGTPSVAPRPTTTITPHARGAGTPRPLGPARVTLVSPDGATSWARGASIWAAAPI
jgi:hypothetical protein